MTALLAALILLLGNAFFVGAEFATISVRRSQLEPLAATSRRAQRVLDGLAELPLMLAGAQLGVTLCSLGLGAVAEPAAEHALEHLLASVHAPRGIATPLALVVGLAVVVFLHTVLGEMVPKNLSLAGPDRAALVLVPLLAGFVRIVRPLLVVLSALARTSLRAVRVEPRDEMESTYSSDELADIIAQSREEGLLDAEEHERLSGALELGTSPARSVMLPLDRLVTVDASTTADELEELVVVTGYSRFPVRGDAGLLGFVHVKDVLGLTPAERGQPVAARQLRPMPSLDADAPLSEVLAVLQRRKSHLGQVVSGGQLLGAIALEDVVEQFVGEVEDETNPLHAPALQDGPSPTAAP